MIVAVVGMTLGAGAARANPPDDEGDDLIESPILVPQAEVDAALAECATAKAEADAAIATLHDPAAIVAKECARLERLAAQNGQAPSDSGHELRRQRAVVAKARDGLAVAVAKRDLPAHRKACKQGRDGDECLIVSIHYDTGYGVKRSARQARAYEKLGIKHFDRACRKRDDADACAQLVHAYSEGALGVRVSAAKARKYQRVLDRLRPPPPLPQFHAEP